MFFFYLESSRVKHVKINEENANVVDITELVRESFENTTLVLVQSNGCRFEDSDHTKGKLLRGPPAVCVNAWIDIFGCVNAWKSKKKLRECVNWKDLRERENPFFYCVNAWICPVFCVNVWIFPFHPDFPANFPDFWQFFRFFPISQNIGFTWISIKTCVNAWISRKTCVNAWILGSLAGTSKE